MRDHLKHPQVANKNKFARAFTEFINSSAPAFA